MVLALTTSLVFAGCQRAADVEEEDDVDVDVPVEIEVLEEEDDDREAVVSEIGVPVAITILGPDESTAGN